MTDLESVVGAESVIGLGSGVVVGAESVIGIGNVISAESIIGLLR